MNTPQTLKQRKPATITPAKPVVDPKEKQDQILDKIAEDCLVESQVYVDQSKAPEGE